MSAFRAGTVVLMAICTAALLPSVAAGSGQPLVVDPFSGPTTAAPLVGFFNAPAASGLPCLTAGTDTTSAPLKGCGLAAPDPAGSGLLRLNDTRNTQATAAVYTSSVPTSAGLDIRFNQYQYGGGGADGLAFISRRTPQPTHIGRTGGALGYSSAAGYGRPEQGPGFPAGYLGIGLDVWGNYANAVFDGKSCPVPSWAMPVGQRFPGQVTVRGPGHNLNGYCLIGSSRERNPNPMNSIPLRGHDRQSSRRAVRITIDPESSSYAVGIDPAGGDAYQPVAGGPLPAMHYTSDGILREGVPPRLTFGFTGSTGGLNDIHEVGVFSAATNGGFVPLLTLAKTDDAGPDGAVRGGTFAYNLTVGVDGDSPAGENAPGSVRVGDQLPAGATMTAAPFGDGWDCSASTTTTVSCANTSTGAIAPGDRLPAITVPVRIAADYVGTTITNTASAISDNAVAPVTATRTTTVSDRIPVSIDWPDPAAIVYGTPLGAAQLDATAMARVGDLDEEVSGTFTYSPPAGTVLDAGAGQVLSVTFAPDDPQRFTTANGTARITVLRAPTTLAAKPVVDVGVQPSLGQLSARLTRGGVALAGRTIAFSERGAQICTATTDAGGTATCSMSSSLLSALLGGGYDAAFAGDASHLPATTRAKAASVAGLVVVGARILR